jgi:hypothetical protein
MDSPLSPEIWKIFHGGPRRQRITPASLPETDVTTSSLSGSIDRKFWWQCVQLSNIRFTTKTCRQSHLSFLNTGRRLLGLCTQDPRSQHCLNQWQAGCFSLWCTSSDPSETLNVFTTLLKTATPCSNSKPLQGSWLYPEQISEAGHS